MNLINLLIPMFPSSAPPHPTPLTPPPAQHFTLGLCLLLPRSKHLDNETDHSRILVPFRPLPLRREGAKRAPSLAKNDALLLLIGLLWHTDVPKLRLSVNIMLGIMLACGRHNGGLNAGGSNSTHTRQTANDTS